MTTRRDLPPTTRINQQLESRKTMTNIMNRFRRMARQTSLVNDERGLSTVEYVIILVLIASAAVGTWTTFGTTIKGKINDANSEIGAIPPS
jgi:Flp pilus assembly pilin Flp